MRLALRKALYVAAAIGATVGGIVFAFILDTLIRSAQLNLAGALIGFGTCLAIIIGLMVLRSFIQPSLHWQRVQARTDRWIDSLCLVAFFLIGTTATVELFTFAWPTLCVAFSAIGVLAVTVALIERVGPNTEPPADGRCRVCGYDLRGATQPRCSECGTELAPDASPAEK